MFTVLERQPAWAVWSGGLALTTLLAFAAYAGLVVPSQQREAAHHAIVELTAQQRADAQTLRTQLAELDGGLREGGAGLVEFVVQRGE
ncbi:MAG: hypothetical protein AAGL98_05150, partial [Planctomycetota bacterium]